MKKLIFILLTFISLNVFSQSFPVKQNLGSKTTQVHVPGLLVTDSGFVLKSYVDTTAANVAQLRFNGSLIKVDSSLFLYSKNKWIKLGSNNVATVNGISADSIGNIIIPVPNLQNVTDQGGAMTNDLITYGAFKFVGINLDGLNSIFLKTEQVRSAKKLFLEFNNNSIVSKLYGSGTPSSFFLPSKPVNSNYTLATIDDIPSATSSSVTVSSYGKNSTLDSTVLTLSNGTRYAAKDSFGGGGSGGTTYTGTLPVVVTGSVISVDTTKAQGKLATFNDVDIAKRWGLSGADIVNLNSGNVKILSNLSIGGNPTLINGYNILTLGGNGNNSALDFNDPTGARVGEFYTIGNEFRFYTTIGKNLLFFTGANLDIPVISALANGNVGIGRGNFIVSALATGTTAPVTTGTTRMAVFDANGLLSTEAKPTGGGIVNVTKAQRDAIVSPIQNQQVFITDDGGYYSYYNNGWVENIPLVVNTKAANYTLVAGDNYIDATVAGITLTLFSPIGNTKEVLFTNSTSASIFIASANGIGNFTTTTNYTLATDKFLRLKSNGTSWKIINAN